MAQALYRAHRPKKLSEVVGQEHITAALTRALANGTISHAYLFTGPRGVGKTTIARILAHEVNNLPYDDESIHLDIIEIDAASNRRIDEIRDLRDKVHIAPTSAKFKVYIIDEVHMLTKEAFNALLKTLEEPPAHVVFILATTEAHKLPETIISRTQRFTFKPVDMQKVIGHLKSISEAEKIKIADDALALIAEHGEGSFRDSISLLDQIRNSGENITLADAQSTLGIAPKELVEDLLSALAKHDAVSVAQSLRTVHTGGHEPSQVARQLGEALREQILSGQPTLPSDVILKLLTALLDVPASPNPKSYLEIALLDAALASAPHTNTPVQTTSNAQPKSSSSQEPEPSKNPAPKVMQEAMPAAPTVTAAHPSSFRKPVIRQEDNEDDLDEATSTASIDPSAWPQILAAIKAKHNTLYSMIHTAEPKFDEPGTVQIICAYAFHQKRLNEKRNKKVLGDIIKDITNENVRINCIIGQPNAPKFDDMPPPLPPADEQVFAVGDQQPADTINELPPEPELPPPAPTTSATATPTPANPAPAKTPATSSAAADPNMAAISNIFGGAELLES